jgi:hypothetical protein
MRRRDASVWRGEFFGGKSVSRAMKSDSPSACAAHRPAISRADKTAPAAPGKPAVNPFNTPSCPHCRERDRLAVDTACERPRCRRSRAGFRGSQWASRSPPIRRSSGGSATAIRRPAANREDPRTRSGTLQRPAGLLGYLTGCPGPGTFAASCARRRKLLCSKRSQPVRPGRPNWTQAVATAGAVSLRPTQPSLKKGHRPYVVHGSGGHHGRHDCVGYAARG